MTQALFKTGLLLAVCFLSCQKNGKKPAGSQMPSHTVVLGGFLSCDTTEFVFLKSSIWNNSSDTMNIVSMACSWNDAYLSDNTAIQKERNICYINVPVLISVPPQQSTDKYLRVLVDKKINDWSSIKFRLGYNLVLRDTSKELFSQVNQIGDMKNVIWSDTIRLADFWKL
jgi:hypothetical protein